MFRNILITLGALAIYILPTLGGATAVLYFFDSHFLQSVAKNKDQKVLFEIDRKWDSEKIAEELERQGVINSWMSYYYLNLAISQRTKKQLSKVSMNSLLDKPPKKLSLA